jgi:hypothetical protein
MKDQIQKMQSLIGVNTKDAFNFLEKNGLISKDIHSKKIRGIVVENLIALLLNEKQPGFNKGRDFKNFEVKTVQVKYIKKDNSVRTCGDTAIGSLSKNKIGFFNSNIWDKTKSIISVLVHDNIIVDILHFDGDKYKGQLKADYESLYSGKNNFSRGDGKKWREVEGAKNKLLVRKDYENYTSNVMIKGNLIIDLSNSVVTTKNLTIDKQSKYLETLFSKNINAPETKTKFFQTPPNESNKKKSVIGANKDWSSRTEFDNEKPTTKIQNISIVDQIQMTEDIAELIAYSNLINSKMLELLTKNNLKQKHYETSIR